MKLRSIVFDKSKLGRLNSTCNRHVCEESVIRTVVENFNAESDDTCGMHLSIMPSFVTASPSKFFVIHINCYAPKFISFLSSFHLWSKDRL
jgi:hypothetical protein